MKATWSKPPKASLSKIRRLCFTRLDVAMQIANIFTLCSCLCVHASGEDHGKHSQ
ncbi:hypothetical protein DPMN_083210 [Dreissena polymorpha]|uniref:Uncharacterized protein n=1 Tax=Dreissena polymorpha TaxID=45954 RepID=A0A9D4BI15_DREPO|nr:hypothetical protein DPMN_083210 [Dreissena polymorpha]